MSATRRADPATLDHAFGALADPTRRAVIRALAKRPRRAGELASAMSISPPALSRHLRVLRRAGLVAEEGIDGDARVRVYRIAHSAFRPVNEWLGDTEAFWHVQLDAFKAHAERAHRTGRRG